MSAFGALQAPATMGSIPREGIEPFALALGAWSRTEESLVPAQPPQPKALLFQQVLGTLQPAEFVFFEAYLYLKRASPLPMHHRTRNFPINACVYSLEG